MKISIVTVALNAEATIEKAVASVVSQRQEGFELEYIIVDGASSDGTLVALMPHCDGIAQIISEPDRGLYDAMNKGIGNRRLHRHPQCRRRVRTYWCAGGSGSALEETSAKACTATSTTWPRTERVG